MKINEEIRTLKEFYPDPAIRGKVHRTFAHRFLPQYIHQNPYGFFCLLHGEKRQEPTRCIQSRWSMIFEEQVGLSPKGRDESKDGMLFRRVSDLCMTIQELAGMPAALVEMPLPEQMAEAFFVCIVLCASTAATVAWPRDVLARVFTLERSDTGQSSSADASNGLLCEWTKEGKHQNYGLNVRAARDEFLKAIVAVLNTPNLPIAGSIDPGSGSISIGIAVNSPAPAIPSTATKKSWWKIW